MIRFFTQISKKLIPVLIICLLLLPGLLFAAKDDPAGETITLQNPLPTEDPNVLVGQVINAILGLVGSLALVMFIYGGFTWMTAGGGREKVQKGKDILIWATIGLAIIFASYALVRFILEEALQG